VACVVLVFADCRVACLWKMPAKEAFPPRDYETCHKCSLHLFEVMFRMAADSVRRLMSGIRIQHMAKKSRFVKLMIWGDGVILIASDRYLTWGFVGRLLANGQECHNWKKI